MKEEILQKINAVLTALNNTTVCGKNNLANLSGSIAILEEVYGVLYRSSVESPTPPSDKT